MYNTFITLIFLLSCQYVFAQQPAKIYPRVYDYTQGKYLEETLEIRAGKSIEHGVVGPSSEMIFKEGDEQLNELLRDKYAIVAFDTIKYVNCILSDGYGYGPVFYETDDIIFYIYDGVTEEAFWGGGLSGRTPFYGLNKTTGRTYSLTRGYMKELLSPYGTLWEQFKTDQYAYYPDRMKEYLHAVYEIYRK